MPGRKINTSQRFRELIKQALQDGAGNPSQVLDWIKQHREGEEDIPVLSTIFRIMKYEMDYEPVETIWRKKVRKE